MKRWTIRICVFLLLGAIINVAVAWGCALLPVGKRDDVLIRTSDGRLSRTVLFEGFGMTRINWMEAIDPQLAYANDMYKAKLMELPVRASPSWSDGPGRSKCEDCRGWPFRCLRYGIDRSGWFEPRYIVAAGSIALPPRDSTQPFNLASVRALPIEPAPLCFAVNTIFYAAILWLLFAAPTRIRRWRRRRRGLCPACAYPVGESEVCTECGGAAVTRGSRSTTMYV